MNRVPVALRGRRAPRGDAKRLICGVADDSPIHALMLVVAHEITGTVSAWRLDLD